MHNGAIETGWNLSDWVSWASKRMGAKLSPEQIQMYVEEIGTWGLGPAELESLERLVRRTCDKWPGPASLRSLGNSIRFNKGETEPIFIMGTDEKGYIRAKPTSERRSVVPDAHTLEQWKAEAAPPGYGEEAFKHAFYMKGLVPPKIAPKKPPEDAPKQPEAISSGEVYRIALGLDSQTVSEQEPQQFSDYDDSPEALRAAGIEVKEDTGDDW